MLCPVELWAQAAGEQSAIKAVFQRDDKGRKRREQQGTSLERKKMFEY
jgi:hypothetical protein